ncbi:MAG: DUF47 domain-containing protein [Chloroflexota bacterium]
MFKSILPKEYSFYDFFENHIANTKKMVLVFEKLKDGEIDFEKASAEIKTYERAADVITVDCVDALHKTFITPLERTDIYDIIKGLDGIANALNGAVSKMRLYEISEIRPEAFQFVEICHKAVDELTQAIRELRSLKNADKIKQHCRNIRHIETDGDKLFATSIISLFHETDAKLIIKWKDVLEKLEKSIDRCQDVGNIIESVLIDNA